MPNYDDWKTATPPCLEPKPSDERSVANAETAVVDAVDAFIVRKFAELVEMELELKQDIRDAWYGETAIQMEVEDMPCCEIFDLCDAARKLIDAKNKTK